MKIKLRRLMKKINNIFKKEDVFVTSFKLMINSK